MSSMRLPAGISNIFQGISAPDQLLTKMKRKMVEMNGTHGLRLKLQVPANPPILRGVRVGLPF